MRQRAERAGAPREGARAEKTPPATGDAVERKLVFLRTVYPLNPGIPHYLDFPQPVD